MRQCTYENTASCNNDASIRFFTDDFSALILKEFKSHPEADAIKFSCKSINPERPLHFNNPAAFTRASFRNIMSAGVTSLAIKSQRLKKYDIVFPESVGPGKYYYCGEDSVFLSLLLRSPLKVFLSPAFVSYIKQTCSSWFHGYDEQYFVTSGYIYARIYGFWSPLFSLRKAWKMRSKTELSVLKSFSLLLGIREFKI